MLPLLLGLLLIPVNLGKLGPYMSASKIPTLYSDLSRARARFIAVVDFPTPPFPLATAIICLAGFKGALLELTVSFF